MKMNSSEPEMSEKGQKFQRYWQLQKDFYASKGVKLYNASLAQRSACYAFQMNFKELHDHIKLHFELQSEGKLGDWRNKKPLHRFLTELSRRLHNFLSSATTLTDNTRCFVVRSYGRKSELYTEYRDAFDRTIAKSPVCCFAADLRNFFTHVGSPFIDFVMGGSEPCGRDRYTLQLDTEKMGQSRPWLPEAREYIEANSKSINLELYVVEYYEKIVAFQEFLDARAHCWSREP
jgi:hypothetical protein